MSRPLTTRPLRLKGKGKVTKCRVTGKDRHPSSLAASQVLGTVSESVKREKVEKRPYFCRHCKGFHLTSLTEEEYNSRKASFEQKEN